MKGATVGLMNPPYSQGTKADPSQYELSFIEHMLDSLTAHEPHPKDKICKFIDFRDDGYETRAHVGLIEGDSAKDKRQHLLDVWFRRTETPSKFCVESTVEPDDEWLHSFYYFNDEIPTDADFEKSIGDYLTFEFSMVMQNREYLFDDVKGGKTDEEAQ